MSRGTTPLSTSDTTICAFDDPVPAGSDLSVVSDHAGRAPHSLEKDVQRRLLQLPGLQILALSVHRLPDGVCLEGTVELDRPCPDLNEVLADIEGIERVVNRLRVRQVDRLAMPLSELDDTVWV